MTDFFDSLGPMAKSAEDVLALAEILLCNSFHVHKEGLGIWDGLAVGFLDPTEWKMAEEICRQHVGTAEQMVSFFFFFFSFFLLTFLFFFFSLFLCFFFL